MDINKEREAFENWHIRNMDINSDFEKISEQDSPYMDEHVNNSWLTWQAAKAQAVPEGYVLMPIKPTETMVMAVVKEHEGDAFLPYSLYDAYVKQAMIEAQEPAND